MKKLILIPAVAALTLLGYNSNAKGAKTADAKTTETVASPSETKAKDDLFTYYVVAKDGSNYTLQDAATSPDPGCVGTESPCEITSPNDLGTSHSQSDIDSQSNGIQIVDRQAQL